MVTERAQDVGTRLQRAFERRKQLGLPSPDTNAYRLLHGAADSFEGLTADVYDRFVVVSLLDDRAEAELNDVFEGLLGLGFEGVYLKRRPRQANALRDEERKARTPELAVSGSDAPAEFVVRESSMPFLVRVGDGLSTGLFLDQRLNRQRVSELAAGKRLLNLFAYTCAFGCAAALGGASATTNLDVSKGALERGRANYATAGLDLAHARFLARDALEALPKLLRREERFDLIVLDPPSYASTKQGRFSVERDFAGLVAACLRLLSEGGRLLACTNQHSLTTTAFERLLREGSVQAERATQIELIAPPADFPTPKGADWHLKSAWLAVR